MAAARYWRVLGVAALGGGDVELGALHLYNGAVRVDGGAVLTCTHAPTGGTLGALQDGEAGTACRFAAAAVRSGGFALGWDLGSATTVSAVRLGAGGQRALFAEAFALQYLDGTGAWRTLGNYGAFTWPGAYTMMDRTAELAVTDETRMLLTLDADLSDAAFPRVLTPLASAALSSFGGDTALYLPESASRLDATPTDGMVLPGDFTIEFFAAPTASTAFGCVINAGVNPTGTSPGWWLELSSRGIVWGAAGSTRMTIPGVFSADSVLRHWALTRRGTAVKAWRAGVQIGGMTFAGPCVTTAQAPWLTIGAWNSLGEYGYIGWLKGVRVTDACLYDDPFTPPPSNYRFSGPGFGARTVRTAPMRASIAASAPVGAHRARSSAVQTARDIEFGGQGRIWGTNEIEITPGNRVPTGGRVVLLRQRDRLLARETWANPTTGAWEFTGLDVGQGFIALAEDLAGNYRPVAANRLTPEAV